MILYIYILSLIANVVEFEQLIKVYMYIIIYTNNIQITTKKIEKKSN